jgi:hypothetical protein
MANKHLNCPNLVRLWYSEIGRKGGQGCSEAKRKHLERQNAKRHRESEKRKRKAKREDTRNG